MRVPLTVSLKKLHTGRWTPAACAAGASFAWSLAQPAFLPTWCVALVHGAITAGCIAWVLRKSAQQAVPAAHSDSVQQELQALPASLQILQRQVRAGIDKSESAVMQTVNQLVDIQQRSVSLHSNASSALEHSNTISAQLQQLSNETQGALLTLEQHQKALSQHQLDKDVQVQQAMTGVASLTPLVGMISDIAKQTQLLSFNAAIEAARAGNSGNGFKIVATEVRMLAQQTTDAAKQIEAGIVKVQQAVKGNNAHQAQDLRNMLQSMGAVRSLLTRNVEHSMALGPYLLELSQSMDQGSAVIRNQVVDALGHMQFQDVLRQILEQVEAGLQALAVHTEDVSQQRAPALKLAELVKQWQDSYVMLEQRMAHQNQAQDTAQASSGSHIELF